MKLSELNIGDKFRRTKKGIVWQKLSNQGMHEAYSSIKTVEKYNTKCYRMSYRETVISQETIVYSI